VGYITIVPYYIFVTIFSWFKDPKVILKVMVTTQK